MNWFCFCKGQYLCEHTCCIAAGWAGTNVVSVVEYISILKAHQMTMMITVSSRVQSTRDAP